MQLNISLISFIFNSFFIVNLKSLFFYLKKFSIVKVQKKKDIRYQKQPLICKNWSSVHLLKS